MEKEQLKNKRIAVVGIGGVGGYMAGMLIKAFPHVTLVARGGRKESIEKNGLVLHSGRGGEIVGRPKQVVSSSRELGHQDYIFICVKNYSLEEVCRELSDSVDEDTVVIPVMNGVDPGERTRKLLGKGTVVDCLTYIVSFANADYSVTQQGEFANLRIGIMNADARERACVDEVAEILEYADIDSKTAKDIEREIWRKYILNCAYNVESAYYDNAIGQLRSDPVKAAEYEALVGEAYLVAKAKGVQVTQKHVDAIIHRFYYELAGDATSSLQRDIRDGKQTELETFGGYLVREAKRLGIEVPVSERMYEGLKKMVGQA